MRIKINETQKIQLQDKKAYIKTLLQLNYKLFILILTNFYIVLIYLYHLQKDNGLKQIKKPN